MARRRRPAAFPRILLLLLLITVMSFAGLLWLDILGLVNARQAAWPLLRSLGLVPAGTETDPEDPLLLEKERLYQREDALLLLREDLDLRAGDLERANQELSQKIATLQERERDQADREKAFNEMTNRYDNRRANLEQNARYLVGMPPEAAVEILVKMEDPDVLDLLRTTEELAQAANEASLVSYWMSLMPADRSATLQRKMARND